MIYALYDDKLRTWKRWNDRENRRVPSVAITVRLPYATLIEKQSVAGVFAQYFYNIFGVPGSVLAV